MVRPAAGSEPDDQQRDASNDPGRVCRRRGDGRIRPRRRRPLRHGLRRRHLQRGGLSRPRRDRHRLRDRARRRSLFGRASSRWPPPRAWPATSCCACAAACPALPWSTPTRRASGGATTGAANAPARELFELPDWGRVAEGLTKAKPRLFFRHHALALFQQRARPLPRARRDGPAAGREGRVRRQFPSARLARRPDRAPARCSWKR